MPAGAALQGGGFGWHPHSGIATLTVAFRGAGWYEDSTGKSGTDLNYLQITLAAGEAGIRAVRERLRAAGRL